MFSVNGMVLAATKVVSSTNVGQVAGKKTGLAGWIVSGGVMMIPIILASIIALAIVIERFLYLRQVRLDSDTFMDKIRRVLGADRIDEALSICENTPGPIPGLIRAGIEERGGSKEEIKEAIEEAATREMPALERYLPALGTIANVSPLLGLLGTVLGMIKSTDVLATQGTANTVGLVGGISVALVTTAAGLLVAIPVLVAHNYFVNRVNSLILEMEIRSTELVGLLTGKVKRTRSKNGSGKRWEKI